MTHRATSPRYTRDVDLAARYGVHRVTVWRWSREGRLPPPVRLGPNCSRWKLADIEQWEAAQEAQQ